MPARFIPDRGRIRPEIEATIARLDIEFAMHVGRVAPLDGSRIAWDPILDSPGPVSGMSLCQHRPG